MAADHVEDDAVALGLRDRLEPAGQRALRRALAAGRNADQAAQRGGKQAGARLLDETGRVEPRGDEERSPGAERSVQQLQTVGVAQGFDPETSQPGGCPSL